MNLNKALIEAINKGSARASRKPLTTLRRDIAELRRQIAELKRAVRGFQKDAPAVAAAADDTGVQAPETETEATAAEPGLRPSGVMVRKLRAKLGVTQTEFAKLAGVSNLTISKWERNEGRIVLRTRTLSALARIRGLSKKAAKAELEK